MADLKKNSSQIFVLLTGDLMTKVSFVVPIFVILMLNLKKGFLYTVIYRMYVELSNGICWLIIFSLKLF